MADPAKLARIHRVRTLQLHLTQAEETRAEERFATEHALNARIAALADAISPAEATGPAGSLHAAAHFRDRLHQSAHAARERLTHAEQAAELAREATRAAKRDQSAVEKLTLRAEAAALLKAQRALEVAPLPRQSRHDPC